MKLSQIRNWLGIYFTLITFILGGYILLFSGTILLPIKEADGKDTLSIIIPVLVGQLTMIYKWFGINSSNEDSIINIPKWVIKMPPILVTTLIIFAIVDISVGNSGEGKQWVISASTFKGIITFCVTMLNATTFFIVGKFFKIES